jgi:hypothetical protein
MYNTVKKGGSPFFIGFVILFFVFYGKIIEVNAYRHAYNSIAHLEGNHEEHGNI